MKKKDSDFNLVMPLYKGLRYIWLNRPGNELHGKFVQILAEIWPECPPYIKDVDKSREDYWKFVVSLPPKQSYSDFLEKRSIIEDHLGTTIQIDKGSKVAIVMVGTHPLKKKYIYSFDPNAYPKMKMPVPIGYSAKGLIVKDLASMLNVLVAGHPNSGKTSWLLNVIVSLLLSPQEVWIVVIDLKRGGDFNAVRSKVPVAYEDAEADFILFKLIEEMESRYKTINKLGLRDGWPIREQMTPILLIIDELSDFSLLSKHAEPNLNTLVRKGRASLIHVIASTQRPSSNTLKRMGDTKAQFLASLCFHVRNKVDSGIVLDNDAAALIPAGIPGRGVYQWDEQMEIQAMLLDDDHIMRLLGNTHERRLWDIAPQIKRLPAR